MKKITLIKDKTAFISYAEGHNIREIAGHFNLSVSYVKNYVGNHKIPHKNLDLWHGKSYSRIYKIYCGMIARCYNSKHIYYKDYGGRGITVCNEWKKDKKAFFTWAENNGYADNLQIDRIDCDKNYCPENCRFVTSLVNQNNRRCTRMYKGIPIGLIANNKECNPLGLKETLLYKRLTGDNGRLKCWDIVTALSTPVTSIKGSHKILPVDKEIYNIVLMKLAKIYPMVLK